MKIPILHLFMTSPFDDLIGYSEKVKECTWSFQQAIECHVAINCETFEAHRQEVIKLVNEADVFKEKIRGQTISRGFLPASKYHLCMYLKAQDSILEGVLRSLDWLSYRSDPGVPEELKKEIFLLVDAVIETIEELSIMAAEAKMYFKKFSKKKRTHVKKCITSIRQKKREAGKAESILTRRILSMDLAPVSVFHMTRISEMIGTLANHAENAADIMEAMIAG